MKNFIPLLLLLCSFTMNAQLNTVVDTIYADGLVEITKTEQIVDKYTTKAYEAVKELASALKVPAEHVYTVLVKQAIVISITWTIIGVLAVIILIIAIKGVLKEDNWTNGNSYNDPSPKAPAILGLIFGVVSLCMIIATFVHMETIVGGFVNPEYYAIKEIIEVF